MPLRRNILIFHLGALGDFIVTWPLALALARIHPQSRIIYISHSQKIALAGKVLGVEGCDIELGWHHLYGDAEQLPALPRRLLAGASAVYSFIAAEGDPWTVQAQRLSGGAEICCLSPRPTIPFAGHITEYLLGQLASCKAVAEAMRQMLHSIATRGLGRITPGARTVVIHPGSGGQDKCWPVQRFIELAQQLRAAGHPLRVVLGPTETERWPAELVQKFAQLAPVHRPQTYLELLALLREAALFIGNDSGPSHLAGILGIPTISLFGPTDPILWRPLGPSVQVLRATTLSDIGVDQVLRAVTEPKH